MSYGDVRCGAVWVPRGGLISIQMPTGIARYHAPEGFAVAADGQKSNVRNPSSTTYDNQKIFKIDEPGRKLAYSVAGIIDLSPDDESDDIVFELLPALAQSVLKQASYRSKTLFDYCRKVAAPINSQLAALKRAGTIRHYPVRPSPMPERGDTIVRVYFDGYYDGIESRVSVRFYHEDQKLSFPPDIARESVTPGGPITFGSVVVSHLLFDSQNKNDKRLARFRKNWDTATLAGAVEICESYIQACSSEEGRDLDKEVCSRIGGELHSASITPQLGFQWIKRPKGAK